MKDPKVTVIVPSCSPDLLETHLRGHRLWTPKDVDICIIDTGLGLQFFPEEWEEAGRRVYSRSGEAATYSGWSDLGARYAAFNDADLLVFANDDTVVTPDWLPTMLEDRDALIRNGLRPGLLGACSNVCAPGPQLSVGGGGCHRNGIAYMAHEGKIEAQPFNGPMPFPRIVTQFAMVDAAAYREVGGFDVDLPAHAWADMVLSYRLHKVGHTNAVSRAFVCHFGSRTLGKQDHAGDFARGREYVRAKYPGLGKALGVPEAA